MRHDEVFVVEQNRDAQLKQLLVNECAIDPARFVSVLHYDGMPITARFIADQVQERVTACKVVPMRRAMP
jgi:2-oxoglutarate ferredoxin oxidoreductase subunit alpha